jgi:aminopeptidase N
VSTEHPALAVEYALDHETAVLATVEASSRWSYIPWLAVYSSDPALADRVQAYANASIPADARADAAKAVAEIRHRARVRSESLPELEAWFATAHP